MRHGRRHRLEEPKIVLGGRSLALHGAELGEQPGQLGPPRLCELLDRAGYDATGPERIDPGSERQDLLALVTSTEHDLAARLDRLGDGRLHQPSLADPRLALDHADRPAAVPGVGEPL